MRKPLLFACFALFFSCGRSGEKKGSAEAGNILENLSYSVDTVVVDVKGEIINLNHGLHYFDLSADRTSLILFDRQQTVFREIDLDQMVIKATYPFELEGSNGIGKSSYFQVLPDGTLMVPSLSKAGIYNLHGDLLSRVSIGASDIDGLDTLNPFTLMYEILMDPKSGLLYSLPGDCLTGVRDLAILDPSNIKGEIIKLSEMEKAGNFSLFWNTENGKALETEDYSLNLIDDILIITCTVGSGIYRYDTKTENLEYFDFPHKIAPSEKTGEVLNEVSTEKDFWTEYRKVAGQISYREIMWDSSTAKHYRLASKTILGETEEEPADYEVYLFAYDQNFNLLGETLLKGLNALLESCFFKDGKLWSYVNVEDELGFAVFTFDF
ncbi:DUF4221 domain-containing protein [Algoriphagus sp. AGSA1]|uniref:DUF4221 family protein n=1 Tax=Algoriphagus sp. AGSA1 TaxID=2907213 RepID=UPI001F43807B|nr:DUF4221 family protein [Algoriphagus sp. AGSA1]MCE7055939.1 DUF4221 domain-containing protein [Algoriphagus sp. AGSA1]